MRLTQIILTCVCVSFIVQRASAQPVAETPLTVILKTVPPNVAAAIIVPHVKTLSDQMTEFLEGMDRAAILLGSRPVDQVKAALGFNVGVNELGGLAIIALPLHDAQGISWALIVPVNDATAFLNGNFTANDDGSHALPDGRTFFAKTLGNHVAIGPSREAIASLDVRDGIQPLIETTFGNRGMHLINTGEMFVFVQNHGVNHALDLVRDRIKQVALPIALEDAIAPLRNEIEAGIVAVDFDALAITCRSLVRAKANSNAAKMLKPAAGETSFTHLPNAPYLLAMSLHGGAITCDDPNLKWLANATGIQLAMYPSPGGAAAGVMNGATVIINTPNSNDALVAIRQHVQTVLQQPRDENNIALHIDWKNDQTIDNVQGVVDLYEIKTANIPQRLMFASALWQQLFGRVGWRGYVRAADNTLAITFSQRPAAIGAIANLEVGGKSSLASSSVLRTMRSMMPAQRSMEAYLGMHAIVQWIEQSAAAMNRPVQLPTFASGLPPIGFAATVHDDAIESAIIAPAQVLAPVIDEIIRLRPAPPQ